MPFIVPSQHGDVPCAQLITPDGAITEVPLPSTLAEAQAYVGGDIEVVRVRWTRDTLLVNSDGRLLGLKPNPMCAGLGCPVVMGPAVLICNGKLAP